MPVEPLMYETHAHTPLCGHASGELVDFARAAAERGLAGVVFTCHNPMPDGYGAGTRMEPEQFGTYQDLVADARWAHAGAVDVRLGLECDYLPGYEPWLRAQIASAPLEYVLGSVHAQYPEYRQRFGTPVEPGFYRTYFDHLAAAAETGLFDCLAHPDLVKIVAPERWDVDACWPWIERSLDRIAATGVALELNTSGTRKAPHEVYPGTAFLRAVIARGIPVIVGADAHAPERVGDGFEEALALLARCGRTTVSVVVQRERVDLDLEAARASLRPRLAD